MPESTSATKFSIRSNSHRLTTEKGNKLASNPFDDKRITLNPINSFEKVIVNVIARSLPIESSLI